MFWAFQKSILQVFPNFWVMKLKGFSGKVKQNVQNYLNEKLVIRSFLGKGFEVPSTKNRIFWAFQKSIIHLFGNFWMMKLKPFSGKVKENVQHYLNQNLVIGSFLENGFRGTFNWKPNVLSVSKAHYSAVCKFLSDQFESIFWESKAKRSKLFELKFGHRKVLRKYFCIGLELKKWMFCAFKKVIFQFYSFKFFGEEVGTTFWETEAKHSKLFKSKFGDRKLLRKWFYR